MENVKRLLTIDKKDITARRLIFAVFRRLANIPKYIIWKLPIGFSRINKMNLLRYKNIHSGKRCFIIANGPSLKNIDFSKMKNEITFGMNRIYLMKEVNGFVPTYLVCIDKKSQLLQFTSEYDNVEVPSFYNWDLRNIFKRKDKHIFLKEKLNPKFSKDLAEEAIGSGRSVTYTCIQLAYYMGFSEVYLIGKDHDYKIPQNEGVHITSNGQEDNHFIKGYYQLGMNWDVPDYKSEEYAYNIARKVFESENKIIKDATCEGKLMVFEKTNLETILISRALKRKKTDKIK